MEWSGWSHDGVLGGCQDGLAHALGDSCLGRHGAHVLGAWRGTGDGAPVREHDMVGVGEQGVKE